MDWTEYECDFISLWVCVCDSYFMSFFWFVFLLQSEFHKTRHVCIFTDKQLRCPTDSIKAWNPSLSEQWSHSSEIEGWNVFPSGSHHEKLADGSCSCSQVGEQAGDWLAFPLDQAHLSGEFTVRPFHIGSLSDWAASGGKGSHFSPNCFLPVPFFPLIRTWAELQDTCLL